MWWALFVLGGPFFWLLAVAWVGLLCWILDAGSRVDEDSDWMGSQAVLLTVIFALVMTLFCDISALGTWLASHWIACVLSYIPAGVLTAFVKWYFYCHNCKDHFDRGVRAFKSAKKLPDPDVAILTTEQWAECLPWLYNSNYYGRWVNYTNDKGTETYSIELPRWATNKSRIATWMAWWWIVLPWSFISDFVHRLFNRLIEVFGKLFNRMAAWIWGTLPAPVVVPPKKDKVD